MKKYGFVYETTNLITGQKYIGKCIYARQNNWETYLGSGTYLKRAIKKYGKENFSRLILAEADNAEALNKLEEELIRRYNAVASEEYYNLKLTAIGGDIFTHHPNKEGIRAQRRRQMSGQGNHQYGKSKTEKMILAVKKANSKAIEIDHIRYESMKEASRILRINVTTIAYRLDSPSFPNYLRLVPKYTVDTHKYTPHAKTKKVFYKGNIYNSIKEAVQASDISQNTFRKRLQDLNNLDYQYVD